MLIYLDQVGMSDTSAWAEGDLCVSHPSFFPLCDRKLITEVDRELCFGSMLLFREGDLPLHLDILYGEMNLLDRCHIAWELPLDPDSLAKLAMSVLEITKLFFAHLRSRWSRAC